MLVLAAPPTWDGNFYHRGALSLAQGFGYAERAGTIAWSHYPVGYSALLAPFYWLFGSGPLVAPLVNSGVGAATAVLAWALARRAYGPRRAGLAGLLVALHPGLILYCALLMTEALAGFLLLLLGWVTLRSGARGWGLVAAGATLAAAAYVRPQSLLAAPLLLLLIPGRLSVRVLRAGAASAIAALLIAPWTLRNCLRLDDCALISTNGGWNLAISAKTEDGGYVPLDGESECASAPGPVAQDRCWAQAGLETIAEDPARWLAKIPGKLAHTYNYESFAVGYLTHARPDQWPEQRTWAWMTRLGAMHHLLMLAALLLLVARPTRNRLRESWPLLALLGAIVAFYAIATRLPGKPVFWLAVLLPGLALVPLPDRPRLPSPLPYLLGLLAATSIIHALFFGADRYHVAVAPAFCILAAGALRRPPAAAD